MRTLVIRLSSISDAKARFVNAGERTLEGVVVPATPSVSLLSYAWTEPNTIPIGRNARNAAQLPYSANARMCSEKAR